MVKVTGGCLCGAIRYEAEGEPMAHAVCFCTDCQKANGGGPTYALIMPRAGFRVTKGEPGSYSIRADSGGNVGRFFCPNCGTMLFSKPASIAHVVPIRAGTLDDPSIYRPNLQIFTASAPPWMHVDPNLLSFERNPPRPATQT